MSLLQQCIDLIMETEVVVDKQFAKNWTVNKVFSPEDVKLFTMFKIDLPNCTEDLWHFRAVPKHQEGETQQQRQKRLKAERIEKLSRWYANPYNGDSCPELNQHKDEETGEMVKHDNGHELSPFDWGMGKATWSQDD